MKFSIRPCGHSDLDLLADWRAEHESLKAFLANGVRIMTGTQKKFTIEAEDLKRIQVIEFNLEPLALVFKTRVNGLWTLSWAISPKHLGEGLIETVLDVGIENDELVNILSPKESDSLKRVLSQFCVIHAEGKHEDLSWICIGRKVLKEKGK